MGVCYLFSVNLFCCWEKVDQINLKCSRVSHTLTVTWIDFSCSATMIIRTFKSYRMTPHSRNQVTWLSRYEILDCTILSDCTFVSCFLPATLHVSYCIWHFLVKPKISWSLTLPLPLPLTLPLLLPLPSSSPLDKNSTYLYFWYNIKTKKKNRILNDIISLHFCTVSSGILSMTTGQLRVPSQFTVINTSS